MKLIMLSFVIFLFVVGPRASALQTISLAHLASSHPRVLFRGNDFASIRQAVEVNADLNQQLRVLVEKGDLLLKQPADAYNLDGEEHTLMYTARDMEGRILLLAGLYQLTGDPKFAMRAKKEMLSAARFPDWYPKHFLDTAEMTTGLGIGYDWIYATLMPDERQLIRNAIVSKGIEPWIALQEAHKFYNDGNNWVQVCYGGEAIGAIAIADMNNSEDEARTERVLGYSQPAISRIMRLFAPDGGFEEGPVYWNYATTYNVLYVASLDSSLGSDFGLSEEAGFSETANYRLQSIGPLFDFANFGDAESEAFPAPEMYWFAERYGNPNFAEQERRLNVGLTGHMSERAYRESARFAILGLLWEAMVPRSSVTMTPAVAASFRRVAQSYMRSSWTDTNAWFVGFKGGDAHASHGHLDLGSFVLDAFGSRWATDLGKDNYSLPGYFKQQRWSYYRLSTEGHNTLTVGGHNEDLDATAPLLQTGTSAGNQFAVADLDKAYKAELRSWRRGIALLDDSSVLVQDDVVPVSSADIAWNFHTAASIEIAGDGKSVTLEQDGKRLVAHILEPASGRFTVRDAQVPPPQASNRGISNLVICLPLQSAPVRIAVLFNGSNNTVTPAIEPLMAWK